MQRSDRVRNLFVGAEVQLVRVGRRRRRRYRRRRLGGVDESRPRLGQLAMPEMPVVPGMKALW